ncbi:MAG: hypothetical protein H7Z40_20845 [Phycisphaerae bacterium]|nr:hypothetical protein [Gemmatimonadaceae bacterium]
MPFNIAARVFSGACAVPLFVFFSAVVVRAQTAIPVRQLERTVSSDTTVLMGLSAVRHLPNGSVLVNDPSKRQLILFDSTLARHKVIADTSTNTPNSYGLQPSTGGLIPYLGDSTLFIDNESAAFLVIDPKGEFARVMAPTRASDLRYISSAPFGMAGFDANGRLIYKTQRRPVPTPFSMSSGATSTQFLSAPDSAPIMRMDLDRRSVDTLGFLKIPFTKTARVSGNGFIMNTSVMNPLPSGDEWTLLPDGTVAIVRAQDYHIDWLTADGKITSSPKMPFDWKRITVEDKQAIVDSVKKAEAERIARMPPLPPGSISIPRQVFVIEPSELPDFYPPVRQGQVRADPDGNVWILPSTSSAAAGGGLTYDVVNREGIIIERVQLPKGRTLAGFGPAGIVYMHHVKGPKAAAIERAQVAR